MRAVLASLAAAGGLAATACSAPLPGATSASAASLLDGEHTGPGETTGVLGAGRPSARITLVELRLRDESGPVAGAFVTLREASADGGPGATLFTALSDPGGAVRGQVARLVSTTAVEVSVFHPDYTGPYSTPALRVRHGAFAPAAWLTLRELPTTPLELQLQRR